MTFSIVARCEKTGMFGVSVASSSPAVAARCAYAAANVGAIASQNVTDPTLGTRGLELLQQGGSADSVLDTLRATSQYLEYRQILIVDRTGATAIHSGANALGTWSEAKAKNAASGGNLLASETVPQAIVDAFLGSTGHIGDRIIDAMRAGLSAGGEEGPIHSAGMKLVREVSWPVADLRIDWTEGDPIKELSALWDLYKPQLDPYVTRALNPTDAPSYGVPGDE